MNGEQLKQFSPRQGLPLAGEFALLGHEHGVTWVESFDEFDLRGRKGGKSELIGLKTVYGNVPPRLARRLISSDVPVKVVLMVKSDPDWEKIRANQVLLSPAGVGLYVKGHGWAYLPHRVEAFSGEWNRFALCGNYQLIEGTWSKHCTGCGELKSYRDYYDNSKTTVLDPKRPRCIECMRAERRARG